MRFFQFALRGGAPLIFSSHDTLACEPPGRGGIMREIKTKYGPGRIATSADKSHIVHRPVTKSSILSSEDNPSVELDIKTSGHGFLPRATRRASPPP